jgi:hypothetical protein
MSDIFLDYHFNDAKAARKLASVFQQQQWSVWMGASGPRAWVADGDLRGTKVIVMLSSHNTLLSNYLHTDVEHKVLPAIISVLIDKRGHLVKPPTPMSFDLSGWDGSATYPELQRLLRYLHALMAAAPPSAPPASFEELSLSKIQESARLGIQKSTGSRSGDGTRFSGVFISYRRNEAAAYAGRLYDRLVTRFGRGKVFIDTENVGWGEDFVEVITSAAESCAVMIALISPRWSRGAGGQEEIDDYVRFEVAKALARKIRVIPILIQGAVMPAPKELPEDLAPLVRRNALALSDARWERDVEDLIKTLEGLLKA